MPACYPSSTAPDDASPLLDEAVRRTVARAIETGELLDVAAEAGRLAAALPETATARVADLLIRAGIEARVNLALGPTGGAEAARHRAARGSAGAPGGTIALRRCAPAQ